MAAWVRNLVMIGVMAAWFPYIIIVGMVRGGDIDPIVWGLPAAVYFTLNPTFRRSSEKDQE